MGLILDIKSGPFAGQKIPLASGQSILIGRAKDRAQFAVPHDNQMSGAHFAVECGPQGCRITDRKSTNGTFLNGARIQEAMLAGGDEIKSGQTIFVVRMVPDDQLSAAASSAQASIPQSALQPDSRPEPRNISPLPTPSAQPSPAPSPQPSPHIAAPSLTPRSPSALPAPSAAAPAVSAQRSASTPRQGQSSALTIGSWAFATIPSGWEVQEGFGIQFAGKDAFPSSIVAMEEQLGADMSLSQYVEAQVKMLRQYLREPQIDAALPPAIPGANETMALEIRYSTKEGHVISLHRAYARSGPRVGVLTLTTLDKELSAVRPDFDKFLSSASFSKE